MRVYQKYSVHQNNLLKHTHINCDIFYCLVYDVFK